MQQIKDQASYNSPAFPRKNQQSPVLHKSHLSCRSVKISLSWKEEENEKRHRALHESFARVLPSARCGLQQKMGEENISVV